jgi:hypothetical protein
MLGKRRHDPEAYFPPVPSRSVNASSTLTQTLLILLIHNLLLLEDNGENDDDCYDN